MFDLTRLLADLETFVALRTVGCEQPEELRGTSVWLGVFDAATELIDFDCLGLSRTARTAVDG